MVCLVWPALRCFWKDIEECKVSKPPFGPVRSVMAVIHVVEKWPNSPRVIVLKE
uniref:Uncharacterized protein n=1 Tax=Anguilla anguilla TaxID=7936 RepID=A0A0E9UMT2_ANGAN